MKSNLKWLSVIGVFVAMGLSRIAGNYYGVDGRIAIMGGSIAIVLLLLVYMVVKKWYLFSIVVFSMTLPLIIGLIGMYLENLYLTFGGIVLLFIVVTIGLRF